MHNTNERAFVFFGPGRHRQYAANILCNVVHVQRLPWRALWPTEAIWRRRTEPEIVLWSYGVGFWIVGTIPNWYTGARLQVFLFSFHFFFFVFIWKRFGLVRGGDQSGSYFIRFTINPDRKAYDNSFDLNAKLIMAVIKISNGLLFCLGFVALLKFNAFFILFVYSNRSDLSLTPSSMLRRQNVLQIECYISMVWLLFILINDFDLSPFSI